MKKSKVLQMPIRNAKGGITQYALRNWEHIDKNRFIFDWVTLDDELSFENDLVERGCKVHHLSCRQEDDEARFRSEMEAILAGGYDAVHLHTSYWRGFLAEELALEAGVPRIIVHAHSTGIDENNPKKRVRLLRNHEQWKAQFHPGFATHFAACSPEAAEFLFGAQIPRSRIVHLRNAIDVNRFVFNVKVRDEARLSLGVEKKFVIFCPARMVYQKNHNFLLAVFAELSKFLPAAVLLLAGDGELRGSLENMVSDMGLSEKVLFLGFRHDIPELLQAADVFVLPSLFEGLGIAAIEAQCSGLFAVLSDTIPESAVIVNTAVRLPLDVHTWCGAIRNVFVNGYHHCDCSTEVTVAGYSIRDQIKVVESIYSGEAGIL